MISKGKDPMLPENSNTILLLILQQQGSLTNSLNLQEQPTGALLAWLQLVLPLYLNGQRNREKKPLGLMTSMALISDMIPAPKAPCDKSSSIELF